MVFASAERVEGIEAAFVERDAGHRVGLLFVLVVVAEADRGAFRTVGAVEQHCDGHVGEVHVLIEAVGPDDDAFALELDRLATGCIVVVAAAAGVAACEGDVVDEEGVFCRVHAAVLGVAPLEGVATGGNVEGVGVPSLEVAIAELLCSVDEELADIPA